MNEFQRARLLTEIHIWNPTTNKHQFIYKHIIRFVFFVNKIRRKYLWQSICCTWDMSLLFTWVNVLHTFSHLAGTKGCRIIWEFGRLIIYSENLWHFTRKSQLKIMRILYRFIEFVLGYSFINNPNHSLGTSHY